MLPISITAPKPASAPAPNVISSVPSAGSSLLSSGSDGMTTIPRQIRLPAGMVTWFVREILAIKLSIVSDLLASRVMLPSPGVLTKMSMSRIKNGIE